jgi:PPE-repeat protein
MTQLDKYGQSAPLYGANYAHCFMPQMPTGGEETGGEDGGQSGGNNAMGAIDTQGGEQNPNTMNPGQPNPGQPNSGQPNSGQPNPGSGFTPPATNSDDEDAYDWKTGETASLCSAKGGSTTPHWWLLLLSGFVIYSRRIRRVYL